jgi:hypothetical protein
VDTLFFTTCLLEAAPNEGEARLSFMNCIINILLSPRKAMYIEGKIKVHPRTGCEGL